jgi:hypothetical protein
MLLAALALLLVAGLAGCERSTGGDSGAVTASRPAAGSSTTLATTTTSARQAAEAAVLADYERFWTDYVAVSATADWRSSRLARYATGKALNGLRLQLANYQARGLVARGRPIRTDTKVTRLSSRQATVAECLDSNQWLAHDAKTGKVQGAPDGKTNEVEATLIRTAGRWKVSVLNIKETECDQ